MDDIPIGEALPGMSIRPLGPNDVPLYVVVMVRVLGEDGEDAWVMRHSGEMNPAEIIGALTMQLDIARAAALECWDPGPA